MSRSMLLAVCVLVVTVSGCGGVEIRNSTGATASANESTFVASPGTEASASAQLRQDQSACAEIRDQAPWLFPKLTGSYARYPGTIVFPETWEEKLDVQTSLFTAAYNLRAVRDQDISGALAEEIDRFIAAVHDLDSAVRANDFEDFVDASLRYSGSLSVLEDGCERIDA